MADVWETNTAWSSQVFLDIYDIPQNIVTNGA